jgi:hypothetical protein
LKSQFFQFIVYILLGVLASVIYAGMYIHNLEYIGSLASLKEATPPFELAILSTVLGGFLLPVALKMSREAPSLRSCIRPDIMITARLFIAAAFSYTTLYALLTLVKHLTAPLNWTDWLVIAFADIFIGIAPVIFAASLSCLGYIIIFGTFWKKSI